MNSNTTFNLSEKAVFRLVTVISLVVFLLVLVLDSKVLPRPDKLPVWGGYLPVLNAMINATCSILLFLSFKAIKQKNIARHKQLNLITFCLSAVFLISYVLYHWMADETRFPLDHPLRSLYLSILISHIVLAALVLPLILLSFYYGLHNQVAKHRKLTKWTFPIWMYVTISGVIVYLMIQPYYPF